MEQVEYDEPISLHKPKPVRQLGKKNVATDDKSICPRADRRSSDLKDPKVDPNLLLLYGSSLFWEIFIQLL